MTPTFNTWDRVKLEEFALESYLQLQIQQEQLEQLRINLKEAIKAYRIFMKETMISHHSDV